MMKLKNIQREKTEISDIVQKRYKKIEFEFEDLDTEDTRIFPVTIYFDYVKSRNVYMMGKIATGHFHSPVFADQYSDRDSKGFWDKVRKGIEKDIRLGCYFIASQDQPAIVTKIYETIKHISEVEEEILLVSL